MDSATESAVTNENATVCSATGCSSIADRIDSGRLFCVQCYRSRQMRRNARSAGKYAPSARELKDMFAKTIANGMACPCCGVVMTWYRADGGSATITLQHDADGGVRLICLGCNIRHSHLPGDVFYDVPDGHKWCHSCRSTRTLSDFYKKRGGRDLYTSNCKACMRKARQQWYEDNREQHLARQRERYHMRKAAI